MDHRLPTLHEFVRNAKEFGASAYTQAGPAAAVTLAGAISVSIRSDEGIHIAVLSHDRNQINASLGQSRDIAPRWHLTRQHMRMVQVEFVAQLTQALHVLGTGSCKSLAAQHNDCTA